MHISKASDLILNFPNNVLLYNASTYRVPGFSTSLMIRGLGL